MGTSFRNIDIFAGESNVRAGFCLGGFRVCQQPLVAGCQPCIFFISCCEDGLFRIRPPRQDNRHAEAFLRYLTRRVVKRCGVDLDGDTRRGAERLDIRGVELAAYDLVFLC